VSAGPLARAQMLLWRVGAPRRHAAPTPAKTIAGILAHQMSPRLGAEGVRRSAPRRELLATGETRRKRHAENAGQDNHPGAQVAALACEGL